MNRSPFAGISALCLLVAGLAGIALLWRIHGPERSAPTPGRSEAGRPAPASGEA